MKWLLISVFLIPVYVFSQNVVCKSSASIAEMEAKRQEFRLGQQRINNSLASANYDVKYYRCHWTVDPSVRYIDGVVTIYFQTNQSASSISLDLASQLIVDSVKRHSANQPFGHTTNELQINFAPALAANTLDSITVWYHGVPDNTGFGSFILSNHNGAPAMWTLSEPYGSSDWWPCKTFLGDKADSIDVYVTHPSNFKAASNGMLQSETVSGSQTTAHWKHRYPIATYLICFAVTNFEVFNNSVQLGATTLPMQTYCYPEDRLEFENATPLVLEAMQIFHEKFGAYPFIREKYGHVQFGWGGGMEHQTSTFIVAPEENLMAHELAHQWFGDKITTNSWQDIWLNEGWATYSAALVEEIKYPGQRLAARENALFTITSDAGGSVKVVDTTDINSIFSWRLSYSKGAYLVRMLQFMMGDDVFFAAVKKYLNDPALAYKFARTSDLKRVMEAESGLDLSRFFQQWYEGQGYPSYHVSWAQVGATSVQIKLGQTTSHSSVPFFSMPVPLTFVSGTQRKTVVVNHTTNNQQFIENIGFAADTVLVDPELWLISRDNTAERTVISNNGNGGVDVFPNPVSNPFTIYLHDFNSNKADVMIVNPLGQVVFKQRATLNNGTALIRVASNNWAKSVYSLKINSGGKTFVKRLVN